MGSGGDSPDSVDYVYNAGLLQIQQAMQVMGQEFFDYWKYGPGENVPILDDNGEILYDNAGNMQTYYQPDEGATSQRDVETASLQGTLETIPSETEAAILSNTQASRQSEAEMALLNPRSQLELSGIQAAESLIPAQTWNTAQQLSADSGLIMPRADLERQRIAAESGLVDPRSDAERAELSYTTETMPHETTNRIGELMEQESLRGMRAPAQEKFYEETMSGINVNNRMNRAEADVEHSYGEAERSMQDQAFRSGIDPTSGRYQSMRRNLLFGQQASKAGARTGARDTAETENWNRLATASGIQT